MKKIKRNCLHSIITFLVLFVLIFTGCTPTNGGVKEPAPADGTVLEVVFIDVAQGDSALVTLPTGEFLLIDAGEKKHAKTVISLLEEKGVTRLDYVIGTHPHADHIGGLAQVIGEFEVGRIFMPKASHNTATFENLLLAIKDKGLQVETAKEGVTLLDTPDLKAEFVAPCGEKYSDLNNYSAVLRLSYGETAFLFMGDAEELSEHEITADVSADVLKVGHHGSHTSTSEEFLKRVNPSIAIISCGKNNSYGHPHDTTVSLLERRNIKIYRTDELGNITVTSDGHKINS